MSRRRSPISALGALVALAITGLTMVACQSSGGTRAHDDPSRSTAPVMVALDTPDPSQNAHGVTVGWPHTPSGAAAAAVGYVRASGLVAKAGPLRRRDVIASFATAAFTPTLVEDSGRELDGLLYSLGERGLVPDDLVWSEFPLTTVEDAVSVDHVQVRVWSVLVVGVAGGSVARQVWRTSTISLRWEDDDWKVDAWDSAAGPTPASASEAEVSSVDDVAEFAGWPAVGGGS
jgi:hypothetical protein